MIRGFGKKKGKIMKFGTEGGPPPEVTPQKMPEDNLGEEEIERKKRGEPGFPRQKAIKEAEIKEEEEEIVNDLQKIFREQSVEQSLAETSNFYENILSKVPEISADHLEKIVNQFLEKNKENRDMENRKREMKTLGLLISATCNNSVEQRAREETKKGTKYEDIKPLTINLQETDIPLDHIGYRNKEKLNLIIKGDAKNVGTEIEGGEITVEGDFRGTSGVNRKGKGNGAKITHEFSSERRKGDGYWR